MPKYACGIAKKRLKNGYEPAKIAAITDNFTLNGLRNNSKHAAASVKPNANSNASRTLTLPEVNGRFAVRSTCRSNSRSAKSFTTQPAERIKIVPSTNTTTNLNGGQPPAAHHNPHSVGQSNNKIPIGLSKRVNCTYKRKRSTTHPSISKITQPSARTIIARRASHFHAPPAPAHDTPPRG